MQTKQSKQIMAALAGFGLAMVAPITSHAFTSQQVVTATAQATVTGGSAAMSVTLRNVAGNTTATSISWSAAAGSGWQQSSQYVQINSTLTSAGAGIQTYTDNTNNTTANPRYTGAVSSVTVSPAGLINLANTAAAPLPTAWQIRAQGQSPEATDDPNNTGPGQTGWAWFYHGDKAQVPNNAGITTAWVDAAPYVTMELAGNPPQIQFAQGSFGNSTSNVNNVYLEANFNNALGGSSYRTSTLTVELFTN